MKKLNQFEKDTLQYIVSLEKDGGPTPINGIFSKFLKNKGLFTKAETGLTYLLFDSTVYGKTDNKALANEKCLKELRSVIVDLIKVVKLLKKLEEQRLIDIVAMAERKQEFEVKYFNSKDAVHIDFPDKKISKIISEYVYNDVLLTEDLHTFIKKGYQTDEEWRHSQTMFWTKIALVVAFVVGITPSLIDIFDPGTTLDKNQYDDLKSVWFEQNRKLDSLNTILKSNKVSFPDTLNVKIKPEPIIPISKK